MPGRRRDGSAGDVDYGRIGQGYDVHRRPEPSFAAAIGRALGDARTVLNVGAGAGSYEPTDREVTAVEPSATMRARRPPALPDAVDAVAESLPFEDDTFDASMTTFSVHQWPDLAAGLREMRRVTRGPVVVMTCDPARLDLFWLKDYAPEMIATEGRRYPAPGRIRDELGGTVEDGLLPIPLHCVDGFNEAFYGRPEGLLDPAARDACSAWGHVGDDVHARFVRDLTRDLDDGTWDRRHGHLRTTPHWHGSLVLVVAPPGPPTVTS